MAGHFASAGKGTAWPVTGLPHLSSVRYHLGMAYVAAGQRAKARAELTEALSLSRTFPEAAGAQAALLKL